MNPTFSGQIHWEIPPDTPGVAQNFGNLDLYGTNCSKCVPRCQTLAYYPDVTLQYTKNPIGIIEVYYRDLTAAKLYRVDRTFANVDFASKCML